VRVKNLASGGLDAKAEARRQGERAGRRSLKRSPERIPNTDAVRERTRPPWPAILFRTAIRSPSGSARSLRGRLAKRLNGELGRRRNVVWAVSEQQVEGSQEHEQQSAERVPGNPFDDRPAAGAAHASMRSAGAQMRKGATAEVRLDQGKATSSSGARPPILGFRSPGHPSWATFVVPAARCGITIAQTSGKCRH